MSCRWWFPVLVSGVVFGAGMLGSAHADQDALEANTRINEATLGFDWPAVQISVGSYEEGPTGLTIFRFKNRASVSVDVRGGAPGTVNTDALRNGYGNAFTDAIVFAGGSLYGEEAITAAATGLKDRAFVQAIRAPLPPSREPSSTTSAVVGLTISILTSAWRVRLSAP